MNYIGDYQDNYIYGTLNNNILKMDTGGMRVTSYSCTITVNYNSDSWNHNFNVPIYNDVAELHFEHFVHSLLTKNFQLPEVVSNEVKVHSFDMAAITVDIEEKDEATVLSTLQLNFKMVPGKVNAVAESAIDSTTKVMLPMDQTEFITKEGILCYTFISKDLPTELLGTYNENEVSTTLNLPNTLKKLHTIVIPVTKHFDDDYDNIRIKMKFADASEFDINEINIIDNYADYHLIAYQNTHNTVSIIEMLGERKDDNQFNSTTQSQVIDYKENLREVDFSESLPVAINTGYIWDQKKYNMIRELIGSFNKNLYIDAVFHRIVNAGRQSIRPYNTNNRLQNETLKFKFAKNDLSTNRIF